MSAAPFATLRLRNGFAVLVRDVEIALINLSSSGCLVESSRPFEVGTIASIGLVLDGQVVSDDVQVVRCQRIEGAGARYHVGMRFLWTTPPDVSSLRRAASGAAAASDGAAPL